MVKLAYRNAADRLEDTTGLELVKVPLVGTKKARRKRPAPAGEILPMGRRLKRDSL